MIRELREIGSVNDAPILGVLLNVASRDWVALAYKNNLDHLSICFWSTRDEERMPTDQLLDTVAVDVGTARQAVGVEATSDALFDIRYKQPPGWDRWLGGIPRPLRTFFDDTLHPKLKTLLNTLR